MAGEVRRGAAPALALLLALLPVCAGFEARGGCRFFLDTADTAEYKSLLPLGLFTGVTTNPTILERAGVPCTVPAIHALATEAFDLGAEEFMAQAWGGAADKLVETGLQLRAFDPKRLVVGTRVEARPDAHLHRVGRMEDLQGMCSAIRR